MATPGEPVVGTAVYGPVRTVVWEDGGREAPSYPIAYQVRRSEISAYALSSCAGYLSHLADLMEKIRLFP